MNGTWTNWRTNKMKTKQKLNLADVREQIQEDIMTFMDGQDDSVIDGLCQIVVDNFKKLEN